MAHHHHSEPKDNSKHGLEGPNSYHTVTPPSSKELGAPHHDYPASSKMGHDRGPKNLIEGPCDETGHSGLYHK